MSRYAVLPLMLLAACSKPTLSPPPTPADTHAGRWAQDIRYVCDNITRLHKNAFHYCEQSTFEQARDDLLVRNADLTDQARLVGLAAVVALLQDGHTQVPFGGPPYFTRAPIRIRHFPEGFCVVAAPLAHQALVTGVLERINDVPIDEVLRRFDTVLNNETDIHLRVETARLLNIPGVLHVLSIAPTPERATYHVRTTDNILMRYECEALADHSGIDYATLQPTKIVPAVTRTSVNYWYERLPDGESLLWCYNRCIEDPQQPFQTFASALLKELDDPQIKRLIIDLRRNGGGSQTLAWPVLKKLKGHRLDHDGGLFVLIDQYTYSSGFGNTLDLRDWTHAVVIGTPFPQRPYHFGQLERFRSPNMNLEVTYSTKWFDRGSGRAEDYLPDIHVETPLRDWLQGRDRGVEAALAYQPEAK